MTPEGHVHRDNMTFLTGKNYGTIPAKLIDLLLTNEYLNSESLQRTKTFSFL